MDRAEQYYIKWNNLAQIQKDKYCFLSWVVFRFVCTRSLSFSCVYVKVEKRPWEE